MKKLVLDTSVLIEYIIKRSPYRRKVVGLLNNAQKGSVELYVNAVTLSEILYVASRIYQAANLDDPNGEALNFIYWVKNRAKIVGINEKIALRAGELRKQLHIALPDCYVIATAEAIDAIPVFREIEGEMKPAISTLRKLGVISLDKIEP